MANDKTGDNSKACKYQVVRTMTFSSFKEIMLQFPCSDLAVLERPELDVCRQELSRRQGVENPGMREEG